MSSLEKPTRRSVLTASGTALAVLVAGCSSEEDDSPAQDGETPPQEPEDNSSRGSGTETEGPEQREGVNDGSNGDEGATGEDDDAPPGCNRRRAGGGTYIAPAETGGRVKWDEHSPGCMGTTRRVLDVGPVAVEVPAVAGLNVRGDGRYAAWSAEDLLTVQVGRYSVSVTDEWLVVFRKYEYVDH